MAHEDLAALGAIIADESSVSAHVLAAAENYRATGVRTYATLRAVEAAKAQTLTTLALHDHALNSSREGGANTAALRERDELRMRAQLLSRLRTTLVARAAMEAHASAAAAESTAPADARDVLAAVGRPAALSSDAAPEASALAEHERDRWRESHVAQVLRGYTSTAPGPVRRPAEQSTVPVRPRPSPAPAPAPQRELARSHSAPDGRKSRATPKASAASRKRQRRVVVSDDDDDVESDTDALDAAPVASVAEGEAMPCPVCGRDIAALAARGQAEAHVERCLLRPRHADAGVHEPMHDRAGAASASSESAISVHDAADGDGEPAPDDIFADENDEDDDVYGGPAVVAAVAASRHGAHITDDWLDVHYERRLELEASAEAEHDVEPQDDATLPGGLRVPVRIHEGLLSYQRDGLKWLWGLFRQRVGGILGDEMGLGKTAQMVALLGSLKHSDMLRCSLIVCPATVIAHWVRELHVWHPALRVLVLHDSSATLHKRLTDRASLIRSAQHRGDVLVTTYEALRLNIAALRMRPWDVVVLDEGHRIRNPAAAVTLAAKQLHCEHRFILTGAPIQNRLKELWSLFDFVYPGRLGPLEMFDAQFSGPIAAGGWSHATPMQVATAYQCALVLRDLINPYLLRRLKRDVNAQLPGKTEQVLFCRLSRSQRNAYLQFLVSQEVGAVLEGNIQAFRAVGVLRKLCNHALLQSADGMHSGGTRAAVQATYIRSTAAADDDDDSDGEAAAMHADMDALLAGSGKLMVLDAVLRSWHAEGHRILLFSQGRRMLDILQRFVRHRNYSHLRMDGTTPVRSRQMLVDRFNNDPSLFLFLLTTRVGGVGINLIGADRVIIFDPDWNPSTDMQARERAWRIGQTKHVVIYRLITAGTIEEKIYHRQIFKTVLTQKVLQSSSSQHRSFDFRDLRELFTLTDDGITADAAPETLPAAAAGKKRVQTETEWLHPSGVIDVSVPDVLEVPDGLPEDGEVVAAVAPAASPTAVHDLRLVAGMEDYHDPDATRGQAASTPAGDDGDEDAVVEHPSRARIDELLHGHAFAGRPSTGKSVPALPGASEKSSTSVLQALFGQGELAGAFSHDSLELPGVSATQKKQLLDAGARVAQAAVRGLMQPASAPAAEIAEAPLRARSSASSSRGRGRIREHVAGSDEGSPRAGEKRRRSKHRNATSTEPRKSRHEAAHVFQSDMVMRTEVMPFDCVGGAALDLAVYRSWARGRFAGTRFWLPSVTHTPAHPLIAQADVRTADVGVPDVHASATRRLREVLAKPLRRAVAKHPIEIANGDAHDTPNVLSSAELLRNMATRQLMSSTATIVASAVARQREGRGLLPRSSTR